MHISVQLYMILSLDITVVSSIISQYLQCVQYSFNEKMTQLSFFLTIAMASVIINASEMENTCPILTHQKNITITEIMGTWYVVRGIEHTTLNPTPNKPGSPTDCRTLTLSQNDQSEIIFQWNGNNIVKFKVNNNNANIWQNLSTQLHGSSIKTLQITEVDDKHIIITSCSESKRISSAVLSREPKFNEQQALAAINKLTEQGLKTINSFDKCQNKP